MIDDNGTTGLPLHPDPRTGWCLRVTYPDTKAGGAKLERFTMDGWQECTEAEFADLSDRLAQRKQGCGIS